MNAKVKLAVGILCVLICSGPRPAHAGLETDIWNGGAGSWTNAAKWSLNVVPNNTSATNYVAQIGNGSSISSSVEIDPSVTETINQLVLGAGNSLVLSNGADLTLTNSLTINGTLTLLSSNNYTYLYIYPGGGLLGGTGQVVMGGFNPQLDILDFAYGAVTNGAGITIEGAGDIESECSSPLVNQGTISADLSNQPLSVSCFINQGRLNALNGGTLELGGTWSSATGVISNNASVIDLGGTFTTAGLGSVVDVGGGTIALAGTLVNTSSTLTLNATTGSWILNGGTIQGGTLAATGGVQLILSNSDSGYFAGVTLDTPLTIGNDAQLNVTPNGVVLNNTTITLTASNNYTYLYFYPSGGLLGGTGQVVMVGFNPQLDILDFAFGAVTNGPDITIEGAGDVEGDCSSPLVNEGTISANLSNQTLSVSCFINQGQLLATNGAGLTATSFTNDGTISATGGTLQLAGSWSNSGVISANASVIDLGGTFTTAGLGTFNHVGGTVTLDGTLINTSSTLTLNATTGSWFFDGTIRGGTVTTTGGAQLILSNGDASYFDGVTLDTPLTIGNDAQLNVTPNGAVLNNTTITLTASNNYTYLYFYPGGGLLGGTGQVVMVGFNPQLDILDFAFGAVTNGPGITIEGGGDVEGDCSSPLVNQGTISANLSNQTLSVSCFINQGRLNALNGGTLELGGTWSSVAGVISNNASVIDLGGTFTTAGLGSVVDVGGGTITLDGTLINTSSTLTLNAMTGSWFFDGTIRGGTLVTTGGAQLILSNSDSGYFDGVTLDTPLTIGNDAQLNVTPNGVVLNNTTITLTASNNYTYLYFYPSGGLLGGTGQVVMVGFNPQLDILDFAFGAVTNGPGITIEGAGDVEGDCSSPLVNQGTISADLSNQTLTVSCFINQGQLLATNGGLFYSSTVLTNYGDVTIGNASTLQFQGNYVQTAGDTVLDGGQLNAINGGSVLIEDGSLGGGGFVNAVVTNFSSISPGPAPRSLVFSSNLVLNAGSTLNFQLGGAAATQYGTAVLSNGVNLAGNLAVSLVNSFVPATGSSFTVLTSVKPITGSFANITSGSPIETIGGAGTFTYIQNSNSIVLENFQPGSQTNSAYLTWAQYYFGCTGCSQAQPNADPDGTGMSNSNQFLAGFNPTDSAAYVHVISIAKTNTTDIKVIYLGANGDSSWTPGIASRTNVLEFTTGTGNGSYSNDFTSTGQTNILGGGNGLGIVTNMVDRGGATNQPARY